MKVLHLVDFKNLKVSCGNCNLHELCLPRGLDTSDLEKLDQVSRRVRPLHKGDVLFRAGEPLNSLYAVRSGCLKLYISSDEGEDQIIGFYLPGEILGLDGVESDNHTCTAIALETSTLCAFPYKNLTEICKHVPALHDQMFRLMGRELSHENQLLLTINKKNAEERIATFLLSLSTRFKRLGYSEMEFRLTMSRAEIGNYLGLTIETISRGLNRFQKIGLLSIRRKDIKILDMPGLKELCSHHSQQLKSGESVA